MGFKKPMERKEKIMKKRHLMDCLLEEDFDEMYRSKMAARFLFQKGKSVVRRNQAAGAGVEKNLKGRPALETR